MAELTLQQTIANALRAVDGDVEGEELTDDEAMALADYVLHAVTVGGYEVVASEILAAMRDRAYTAEATLREVARGQGTGHYMPVPMARMVKVFRQRVRVRQILTDALAEWEPEHERVAERAERKGYSHDEAEARVYAAAIETVRAALAALDGEGADHG